MKLITAPEAQVGMGHPVMFLAGGITNCPDWQAEVIELLKDVDVTLLNPRRANFPIGDPGAAQKQIEWEHHMLRWADWILFWFPCETLCPIVLYELGAWTVMTRPLFIGVHPDYARKQDVMIQTRLVRSDQEIVFSLEGLVDLVKAKVEVVEKTHDLG